MKTIEWLIQTVEEGKTPLEVGSDYSTPNRNTSIFLEGLLHSGVTGTTPMLEEHILEALSKYRFTHVNDELKTFTLDNPVVFETVVKHYQDDKVSSILDMYRGNVTNQNLIEQLFEIDNTHIAEQLEYDSWPVRAYVSNPNIPGHILEKLWNLARLPSNRMLPEIMLHPNCPDKLITDFLETGQTGKDIATFYMYLMRSPNYDCNVMRRLLPKVPTSDSNLFLTGVRMPYSLFPYAERAIFVLKHFYDWYLTSDWSLGHNSAEQDLQFRAFLRETLEQEMRQTVIQHGISADLPAHLLMEIAWDEDDPHRQYYEQFLELDKIDAMSEEP